MKYRIYTERHPSPERSPPRQHLAALRRRGPRPARVQIGTAGTYVGGASIRPRALRLAGSAFTNSLRKEGLDAVIAHGARGGHQHVHPHAASRLQERRHGVDCLAHAVHWNVNVIDMRSAAPGDGAEYQSRWATITRHMQTQ